ncbi:hypothetical protein DPEC_G00326760 [Dallia pectoralis]|uniref:Uncharacterized protein n=1 Tax=Dallia pectoralis TaxID=75939 RepID=A0ACC2F7Z0_DALPE|nr:hypothetical protein DPEC_G00326760 [Dallia pectoralis]
MVTGPDSLYVTLLILLHSLTSESEKFEVLGPTEPIVAVAGDDIILPCYLKPNISVEDMTVDWLNLDSNFKDKRVYRYENGRIIIEDQIPSYRERTSLFTEELGRGNTSLKLTRLEGSDEGRYKCFIKSKDWYDDVTVHVLVKDECVCVSVAVGSRPVVSIEGHREGGMGLVCQSEGWHPEPDLVWLDSKGVNISAGPPEIKKDSAGLYTVKQHVIIQETDTNLFTCRVSQSRINEEVETEVHIPSELFDYTIPWKQHFIVLFCLGVITVIGSVLAAYWIHRKKDDVLKENDDVLKENGIFMEYVFDTIRRHAVDVTLDPVTAHPNLILTEGGKQVRRGDIEQDLPDNPERFDYYPSVLGKEGFSSVKFQVLGPTEPIVAVAGDDIILRCYLKPNISVEDMTVDWLNLEFIDERVYRYDNGRIIPDDQIPSYKGRTSLFKEELRRGNASLKLTRVQVSDEGHYKCFIKSKDWYDDITIQVLLNAVGSRPVVSIEGHREGGMGLVCQSEGWHPEPDLVWLDSKGVSLSAGPPETHRDIKGFYTVKQHVIVQETDTNLFTCRVSQSRINEEVETEVHIPSDLFDYTWRRSFIVLCVLGVITVIGLSLTIYWIFKKKVFDTIRRHAVDVTLDPDTAFPYLILSEDGKQVRRGDLKQDLPDNPKRFDLYPSVLGKDGFSSGRFYYEVQVKEKEWWIFGFARESVERKTGVTETPDKGYWTLWLMNGEYKALTDPFTPLSLREKPQKVGVFVDYEEGQVSFFNVETRSHIYSFTGQTFTEKLYPCFHPGYDSSPLVICPLDVTK